MSVPSSKPAINQLQTLFGAQIERKAAVLARKTGHKKPLSADYAESYVIHADRIAGRRVLLVDDVCTSGATLEHFTGALQAAGFDVVPMALAFDHKLPTTPGPEIPENVTLTTPATGAANSIEQEIERMAGLGAPETMIADALGISVRSIQRKYSAITRRARAYRRLAILALQMEAAKKLNPAILIWLGNNELGQVDTPAAAEVKRADTTLNIVRIEPPKMLNAPAMEA